MLPAEMVVMTRARGYGRADPALQMAVPGGAAVWQEGQLPRGLLTPRFRSGSLNSIGVTRKLQTCSAAF